MEAEGHTMSRLHAVEALSQPGHWLACLKRWDWQSALRQAKAGVFVLYIRHLKESWFRYVLVWGWPWGREERVAVYLQRIEREVQSHDGLDARRQPWWYPLSAWLRGISSKRRLIRLHALHGMLATWSDTADLSHLMAIQIESGITLSRQLNCDHVTPILLTLSCLVHVSTSVDPMHVCVDDHHEVDQHAITLMNNVLQEGGVTVDYALVTRFHDDLMAEACDMAGSAHVDCSDEVRLRQELSARVVLGMMINDFYPAIHRLKCLIRRLSLVELDPQGVALSVSEGLGFDPNGGRWVTLSDGLRFYVSQRRAFDQQLKPAHAERMAWVCPEMASNSVFDSLHETYQRVWDGLQTHFHQRMMVYEQRLVVAIEQLLRAQLEESMVWMQSKNARAWAWGVFPYKPSAAERGAVYRRNVSEPMEAGATALQMLDEPYEPLTVALRVAKQAFKSCQAVLSDPVEACALMEPLNVLKQSMDEWNRSHKGDLERLLLKHCKRESRSVRELKQLHASLGQRGVSKRKLAQLKARRDGSMLRERMAHVQALSQAYQAAAADYEKIKKPIDVQMSCELMRVDELNEDVVAQFVGLAHENWLSFPRPLNHFIWYYRPESKSWHVLGRDAKGRVHRIVIDPSNPGSVWHTHGPLLLKLSKRVMGEEDSRHVHQVLCYPLLVTLSKELGQFLFTPLALDGDERMAEVDPHDLQPVSQLYYERHVLPVLGCLLESEEALQGARDELRVLYRGKEEEMPDACWQALLRSAASDDQALPSLKRPFVRYSYIEAGFRDNGCRELVPYGQVAASMMLPEDELVDCHFDSAVVDFYREHAEFRMDLLNKMRAHASEDVEGWMGRIKGDKDLKGGLASLKACRTAVIRVHPDRYQDKLKGLDDREKRYFENQVKGFTESVKDLYEGVSCLFENDVALRKYVLLHAMRCLHLGLKSACLVVEGDILEQLRHEQHHKLPSTLRGYKQLRRETREAIEEGGKLSIERSTIRAETAAIRAERAAIDANCERLEREIDRLRREHLLAAHDQSNGTITDAQALAASERANALDAELNGFGAHKGEVGTLLNGPRALTVNGNGHHHYEDDPEAPEDAAAAPAPDSVGYDYNANGFFAARKRSGLGGDKELDGSGPRYE